MSANLNSKRLVPVYAYITPDENGNIFPKFPDGRLLIAPPMRYEYSQPGSHLVLKEDWDDCVARAIKEKWFSCELPEYTPLELEGKTELQGRASETLEETFYNPPWRAITSTELHRKKLQVMIVNLDNPMEDPKSFCFPNNARMLFPDWLKERIEKEFAQVKHLVDKDKDKDKDADKVMDKKNDESRVTVELHAAKEENQNNIPLLLSGSLAKKADSLTPNIVSSPSSNSLSSASV